MWDLYDTSILSDNEILCVNCFKIDWKVYNKIFINRVPKRTVAFGLIASSNSFVLGSDETHVALEPRP